MSTAFCEYVKKIRAKENESLRTMAKKLEISAAFLSAMEVGKRKIPLYYVERIGTLYNLTEKEKMDLEDSIHRTNGKIRLKLNGMTKEQIELAINFSRKIKTMSDEKAKRIYDILIEDMKNKGLL